MNLPSEPNVQPQLDNSVRVPRWVILVQAGLLCLLPVTCFLLGLAAAQLARPSAPEAGRQGYCEVSGRIITPQPAPLRGVVLILPLDRGPAERMDPRPLHPETFQELANPAILEINRCGGGVSRTSDSGGFRIEVSSPGRYLLVFIASDSTKRPAPGTGNLDRSSTAELSRWFLPLENLTRGRAVHAMRINAGGDLLELGPTQFPE